VIDNNNRYTWLLWLLFVVDVVVVVVVMLLLWLHSLHCPCRYCSLVATTTPHQQQQHHPNQPTTNDHGNDSNNPTKLLDTNNTATSIQHYNHSHIRMATRKLQCDFPPQQSNSLQNIKTL